MGKGHNYIDEIGNRYGRLVVVSEVGRDRHSNVLWKCKCDCGNETIVNGTLLRNGHIKSCGCLKKEIAMKQCRIMSEKNKGQKRPEHSERMSREGNPFYGKKHTKESKNKVSGKNHYNWRGGITLERDKAKNSFEYKQWRHEIFERDNYTCQMCGDNKGGNLQAHHILPWANFKEFRHSINNGITLCKKCHELICGKELKYVLKFLNNLRKSNKLIKEHF